MVFYFLFFWENLDLWSWLYLNFDQQLYFSPCIFPSGKVLDIEFFLLFFFLLNYPCLNHPKLRHSECRLPTGCQLSSKKFSNGNYYIWVYIFLFGEKLQTCGSCLNAYATYIIMYIFMQLSFLITDMLRCFMPFHLTCLWPFVIISWTQYPHYFKLGTTLEGNGERGTQYEM